MVESAAVAAAPEPVPVAASDTPTVTKPNSNPPATSVVVPVPVSPSPPSSPRVPRRARKAPRVGADRIVALATYICSLPLLGYGVWLLCTLDYNCEDVLRSSSSGGDHLRGMLGTSLLVAFVASCVFSHYGPRFLYPGALSLAVVLLGMMILGIVFLGSFAMESRGVPFAPVWLRTKIEEGDTWAHIKHCVYESRTCQDLAFRSIELTADDFMNQKLSPIESGCCKPPYLCGMEYVNATYWRRPQEDTAPSGGAPPASGNGESPKDSAAAAGNAKTFGDCLAYGNADTQLCYDCRSCKQGFVESVRSHRRKDGAFFVSMSVILLAVHTLRFVKAMVECKGDTGSAV